LTTLFHKFLYLLILLGVLGGGLFLHQFFPSVMGELDSYFHLYQYNSSRMGVIPALRGRILDKNGYPITWSSRYFSLLYRIPTNISELKSDMLLIKDLVHFNHLSIQNQPKKNNLIILKGELTPEEMLTLGPIVDSNPNFKIKASFRREIRNDDARIINLVGKSKIIDSVEVGISGLEKLYNSRLTGVDG